MQNQLNVVYRNVESSEALETHIQEKVEKLAKHSERITSCQVTIEQPHKHRHQGRRFNVRVDLVVPGAELVATRDNGEDVYAVLRDAFDHVQRQLEAHIHRQRGEVKHHEPSARQRVRTDEPSSE